ncbi:MAG: HPr family phosphocarrier protein [Chitinispirillaceae bacterium]|nr:HPr family phosphocarrier protein [Chitinispirillaceae bacterium]
MIRRELIVTNSQGLHARPSLMIQELSQKYKSKITIKKDGVEVDAKSVLNLLTLSAGYGSKIILTASGEDEKEAIEKISELFRQKFYEE